MADEAPTPAPTPKKKLPKMLLIVLAVALGEAAAFFVVFNFVGRAPAPAHGESSHVVAPPAESGKTAEAPAKTGETHGAATPKGTESQGGEPGLAEPAAAGSACEVVVLKNFRVPNDKTGRMYIYDMDVSVVTASGDKERLEKIVKERTGEIADSIALIMRRATERTLQEDDLRALRYQIREGLLEIIRDEKLIQRVLIPRFVPIRAD